MRQQHLKPQQSSHEPALNIAVNAARQAGAVILRAFEHLDTIRIETKGRNDFVSEIDKKAEQTIISTLRRSFPDDAILAEESGVREAGEGNEYEWIIDPLDGTTNFLHGFPQFSISIARSHRGQLQHGLVFDPLRDEMFTASRGRGAQLNQTRLRVSKARELGQSLLGTGFPYRENDDVDGYLAMFKAMMTRTAGIRRPGSAALDLAYVAAGRLDGFWEANLQPWDMAAGCLLIREAGGLVGDFAGGENHLNSGNVIAANPKLFAQMQKALAPVIPANLRR
jgi:myo-inositol-1(or 4)-monophosphatase